MVQIYCARLPQQFNAQRYGQYLAMLPYELQQRNLRFTRWQDRWSHMAGKILLKEALLQFGFGNDCLDRLQYNAYNRPFLPVDIDFNISHSGDYILCAIAQSIKLGIDIEAINAVEFADFAEVMTNEQWTEIKNDTYPTRSFFSYWARKESVIKADSRGLSIPLTDIIISGVDACCNGKTWYLKELDIDSRYCSFLATDIPVTEIHIHHKQL